MSSIRVFCNLGLNILIALVIGCARDNMSTPGDHKAKEEQQASPDADGLASNKARSKAIKAAETHLKALGGLTRTYDVDTTAKEDGVWWVTFSPKPSVPGGFCTVVVDKKGKVIEVLPGE